MNAQRVLFLCTGNSARSQMAEALLRRLGGGRFEVYSAGLELAAQVNPYALRVMAELGYDLSGHYVKHLDTFIGQVEFDYLITVCGHAEESCPFFPGMGQRLHWAFQTRLPCRAAMRSGWPAFARCATRFKRASSPGWPRARQSLRQPFP